MAGVFDVQRITRLAKLFANAVTLRTYQYYPHLMARLYFDLRFALRNLRRSPLFTFVAVASLALGIGANTAIFTLIDQLMLRLLPVSDPEQLVLIYATGPHLGSNRGSRASS